MSAKVGVDGGGTKTECILLDDGGRIIARRSAAGCNPNVAGRAAAAATVREALAGLVAEAGSPAISLSLFCMAGNRAFWREFAASLEGFGRAVATDDSLPVLELATGGTAGLVLHAGTGSFVAARSEPGTTSGVHYAGGLGFRFGDSASGYDIGRRAVARGLLEIQGWDEPSGVGALVRRLAGAAAIEAALSHFYDDPAPNAKIAAVAPEVLRLAGGGDPVATAIVAGSVRGLVELALGVAAQRFPDVAPSSLRAALSGPVLAHPAAAQAAAERCPWNLTIVSEPPIEGVRRLCQRMAEN